GQREGPVEAFDERGRRKRRALGGGEAAVALDDVLPAERAVRPLVPSVVPPVRTHEASMGDGAQRLDRAADVAGREQRVRVCAEDQADGVLPSGARADPFGERSVLREARTAERLPDLVDAGLPGAEGLRQRREAVLDRARGLTRRVAGGL